MALDLDLALVTSELFTDLEYPWEGEFAKFPKVPSMDIIVDWAWNIHHVGLIPFERNPVCQPHPSCKPLPVWYNGEEAFCRHLSYGEGVIECELSDGRGHMVAWDGKKVYDPEGYIYDFKYLSQYEMEAARFWLCT
jgi:hypothetical protein